MPVKKILKRIKVTQFGKKVLGKFITGVIKGGKYVVSNAEVAYNPKSGDVVIRIKKEV